MSIKDLPRWVLPAALGAVAVVILAVILVSRGDDEIEGGPAALVPANAPVYSDFVLRPEGEAKTNAEAAVGTVLDSSEPGEELITVLEKAARDAGEDIDFEEDVEPWLGERAALFFSSVREDGGAGAFILETTDSDAALLFLAKTFGDEAEDEPDDSEDANYKGVDYTVDSEGDAFGVIDDFLVAGNEDAFKAAVDASEGDSLAESDEFSEATDELDPGRLATLYVPIDQIIESIGEENIDPQARALLERAIGDAVDEPVLGQVTASATDVTLELSAGGGEVETAQSSLLESLPADTWLALGLGDVGESIQTAVSQLGEAGIDPEVVEAQVLAQTGIELDALTAALGEAGIFVRGTSVATLGGALIIQDKDPTVTANLLDRLQGLIKRQSQGAVRVQPVKGVEGGFQLTDPTGQLQQPILIVRASGKIVAGYGAQSVRQAAQIATAPRTLSEEQAFQNAEAAVGDLGVDLFLAIAPILALAESEGAGSDSDYGSAKPYLQAIDFLAVGSGGEDGRSIARFVFGLN
jgi:hypothetical protein